MAKRQRILEFQDWASEAPAQSNIIPNVPDPTIDSHITPKVWSKQNFSMLPSEVAGDVEAAAIGRFTLYYSTNNLGMTSSDIEAAQTTLEEYLGDSVVDFQLEWDSDKKLTVTGEKVRDMGSAEDYEDNEEQTID